MATIDPKIITAEAINEAFKELTICGITLSEWAQILDNHPMDGLWICDPEKAEGCQKTGCHINGGDCWLTSRKDWRKEPEKAGGWNVLVRTDGEFFAAERVSDVMITNADGIQMQRLEDGSVYLCEPTK